MSVFPYLKISHNRINDVDYSFTIENNGIGPAIIESIKTGKNGSLEHQDFYNFLRKEIQEQEILDITYANLYKGALIPEKENIELFRSIDTSALTAKGLYELLSPGNLDFEIVYSSIYNEKWKITNKSSVPTKLK